MTPQELKNSILQLAIQGRLVEQRPEEGTAEELYRQIQAEKQRLIKEGKIKKEKPLPEITEEEKPFEIPESWKWCRLGELCTIIRGITFPGSVKSRTYIKGCIRCATTGSVQAMYNKEADVFVPEQYVKNASQWLENEDVVISTANSKELVGKSCLWHGSDRMTFGGFLTTTRFPNAMCRKYAYYVISHLHRSGVFARASTQTTNIANLNNEILSKMMVPLPPLAEQRRIVAKIEELLPYIDRYEQAWSKLEDFNKRFPVDMQKSILQTAIQGKLVEQRPEEGTGDELYRQIQAEKQRLIKAKLIRKGKESTPIPEIELPFDLPETWKWIRLGDILSSTDAGKSPQCENRCRNGNEWGVIKTTAVQDGYFLADENKVLPAKFQIQDSQIIHQGDFLITRAGPKNRTGIMCVVDDEPANIILSDKTVRLAYVRGMVEPKYLMCALSSPAMQHWVVDAMTGMAASQVNISQDKMWTFVLPLPPLAEQKRIVAKLEELLPLCERLK